MKHGLRNTMEDTVEMEISADKVKRPEGKMGFPHHGFKKVSVTMQEKWIWMTW